MPRKRNTENRGLPSRWQKKHGAFYFQVPKGMEPFWDGKTYFRLGKTEVEAYRTWSARIGYMDKVKTIGQLLERYEREVIPEKAEKTSRENIRYSFKLRAVFGNMPLAALRPQHIYQYVEQRSKKVEDDEGNKSGGLVIARREIALLSHAYTKAVEWGFIARHPFKGEVRLKGEKPRTRYVEDWELEQCLKLTAKAGDTTKVVQAYIRLKLLTGLRQSDLLHLREENMAEDGLRVTPKKTQGSTGKSLIITWTPALRDAVKHAIEARPATSQWIFCTRRGALYNSSGWQSIWQRFMKRCLNETELKERFTEHDLRAKTGSDMEQLDDARKLLAHADAKITEKVYRRKAIKVNPLR